MQERVEAVNTYFASAERSSPEAIREATLKIDSNPIVSEILRTFGSILAVLNRHRQIIAANEVLLETLGVSDVRDLLGLRPGEALRCTHAEAGPGGCGTSEFCSTCGAAVSIVLSQETGQPVERECLVTIKGDREEAIEFNVRAVPTEYEGERYIILLIQDIRDKKRRESLEQVFFHDLLNSLAGLSGYLEIYGLTEPEQRGKMLEEIEFLCSNVVEQVRSQRVLSKIDKGNYQPELREVRVIELLQALEKTFASNGSGNFLVLELEKLTEDEVIETDYTLLLRVLINMCKNALEATPPGGRVRFWHEASPETVEFKVWNEGEIPREVAIRIFQRYFSTKKQPGRGLGTYSMKLFGEGFLHGKVGFTSSLEDGTVFSLRMARRFGK